MFQIAKYALMQVTALVYGVLICGLVTKGEKTLLMEGQNLSNTYWLAVFCRDYGIYLSVLILIWTTIVAFYSSPLAAREIDELWLTCSGLLLAGLFAAVGTYLFFALLLNHI